MIDWKKANKLFDEFGRDDGRVVRFMMNMVSCGILIIDNDGRIIFSNRFFDEMMAFDHHEILGNMVADVVKNIENGVFIDLIEKAKKTRELQKKVIIQSKENGKRLNGIDVSVAPLISKKNKMVGLVIAAESSVAKKEYILKDYREQIFSKKIFSAMTEGVTLIDDDGKLEYANQRFHKLLGYNEGELYGKHWSEWVFEEDMKEVNGKKILINEKVEDGVYKYQIRLKKKNGYLLSVLLSVSKNINKEFNIKSFGLITDITERVKLEGEYKEVSFLNKKILETISTGIITLDQDLRIKSINNQVEVFFNKSKENILGKRLSLALEVLSVFEEWSAWVLRSLKPYQVDRYKLDVPFEHKVLFVNVRINPLYDQQDRVSGVVCAFDDVTLSAKLEEKIEFSYRRLEITHAKLNNFLKRQSDFLADVSHELRTPLTIMSGNVELSLKDKNSTVEELRETLMIVDNEVQRMSGLVGDLMTLTKMEGGEISIRETEFFISDLVEHISSRVDFISKNENDVIFKKVYDSKVCADKDKMEALLWNLIENGLKYNKKNGIVTVDIHLNKKNRNNLVIVVSDNGIGIPKEDISYIFDRFYRVDKARTRDRGGSGLGLAICKWIVQAHRGTIRVKSEYGIGTKFIVNLPIIAGKNLNGLVD